MISMADVLEYVDYNVTLDIIKEYKPKENIVFIQNDKDSAKLLFTFTKNNKPLDMSSVTGVTMAFRKPDQTLVWQGGATEVDKANGVYMVVLRSQVLASVGKVFGHASFTLAGKTIETRKMFFQVEESFMSDSAIESNNDFPLITEAIEATNENAANIKALFNDVSAVNIENFGAKDDGTDTSASIEAAISYAVVNKIPIVKCKGGTTYKIEKVIDLPDNITFDGGNSLFLFENTSGTTINPQGAIRQSWRGVFNAWGRELPETTVDLLGYDNTTDSTEFVELRVSNSNNFTGRWKVSNASSFNRGDFVKINVPFRGMTFDEYYPVTEIMAKVIEVDKVSNYIYTDYYTPFDYKTYSWRAGIDVLVKVEPRKNVSINNVRIKDVSPDKNRPPVNTAISDGLNRHLFPCGIGIAYGYNINIENVQFENLKFSGVTSYYGHSNRIDGLVVDTPAFVGPGEGYGTQNMNIMNYVIEKVRGYGAPRHLVDVSSGAFVHINDCISSTVTNSAFDLHGEGEHDITYENCVGSFSFGNGLKNFNDIGHNITLKKCKGRLLSTGYTTNLNIYDSDISFVNSGISQATDINGTVKSPTNSPQVRIFNSTVTLRSNNKFEKVPRGRTDSSWFVLDNCEVKAIFDSQFRGGFSIVGYDNVSISNCKTREMSKGYMIISIEGSKKVDVQGNQLKDTLVFAVNKSVPFIDYRFKSNLYEFTEEFSATLLNTYDIIIRTDVLDNVKGSLRVEDNTVNVSRTTGRVQNFLYADAGKNTGSELHLIVKENILYADNAGLLRANVNTGNTGIKLTTLNNHFYSNVVKKPFAGSYDLGLRYFENAAY